MQTIEILGVPASPYTRKMLALLRYRRIPYRVLWGSHIAPPAGYPAPKVNLLPTIYLQTDAGREAMVDSTPIIDRLELLQPERAVRPNDAVLHFLDLLIEDFADEWLSKAMFHYRWHFAPDAKNAGPLIAFGQNLQFDSSDAMAMSESFSKRQISRLSLALSLPWLASTEHHQRRTGQKLMVAILVLGLVLGAIQTLRCAHYPSHTAWTALICAAVAWGNHHFFACWPTQREIPNEQ